MNFLRGVQKHCSHIYLIIPIFGNDSPLSILKPEIKKQEEKIKLKRPK